MNGRIVLLIASLSAAWPTAVCADDDERQCSVATLRGSYGVTFTGTANTPGGPSTDKRVHRCLAHCSRIASSAGRVLGHMSVLRRAAGDLRRA